MRILWRTLLLIALCVQLPLSALASYADGAQLSHEHAHAADTYSHHAHPVSVHDHEAADDASDCTIAHHHCTASHLSLMVQTLTSPFMHSERQSFDLRAEAFSPTHPIPSIERPKWAFI
jgi:hypothetical protein